MPADSEDPTPMLYMDREGSGHFALDPIDLTLDPVVAPAATKSVLNLVVEAAPVHAESLADADTGVDLAVAARDLFMPSAAAKTRARRDRVREAVLVRTERLGSSFPALHEPFSHPDPPFMEPAAGARQGRTQSRLLQAVDVQAACGGRRIPASCARALE